MLQIIMGKNPFVNGKHHTLKSAKVWDASPTMKEQLNLRIQRLMEERGFNYKSLSLAAKLGETAVRDILVGRVQNPRRDTLEKIARALGTNIAHLISDASLNLIPIIGNVGAGGEIYPMDDLPLMYNGMGESDRAYVNCEFIEAPPSTDPTGIVAVRVIGESMLPFMPEGTIVYYNQRIEGGCDDCLQKLCIVQLKDGPAYLKILKRGRDYGHYDLISYNLGIIENVELEWCAKIIFIRPT